MCRRFQGTKSKEGDQVVNCISSTERKKKMIETTTKTKKRDHLRENQ